MNESETRQWQELGWRRRLTTAEELRLQSLLVADPSAQSEWEEELALNDCLRQLSAAPVSSNFTAQVLATVERDQRRAAPRVVASATSRVLALFQSIFSPGSGAWGPRLTLAAVLLGVGLISFREHQLSQQTEMAVSVEKVTQVATLPKMEWLKDFEAINRLNPRPVGDNDLLAVLDGN